MLATFLLLASPVQDPGPPPPPAPFGAVPDARQLAWHELEFYGFLHFSVNTFTDREWGYGDEDPAVFAPTDFDADQIAAVAAAAGMRGLILTCKHHDGFCLWPSATTEHDVAASPFRGGRGDVVREVADACRRHGLRFGVYLSPWDRNHPDYGRPEYVAVYRRQLRELLTHYGPVFEVWWDGANGGDGFYGGARETRWIDRGSYYGWEETTRLVRELQPEAVIFSDAGDIRWVGNERGIAGDPCWATYTPRPRPGESAVGPGTTRAEEGTSGTRFGARWMPAEADVSIRPGWFHHPSQDGQVKSPAELVDLYYRSVGRGAALLLNIPPDRRGRIPEPDAASLRGMRTILDATFRTAVSAGATASASEVRGGHPAYGPARVQDGDRATFWTTEDGTTSAGLVLDWGEPRWFDVVSIREYLPLGQRVDRWALDVWDGTSWREFARGRAIGPRRLWRGPFQRGSRVRLRLEDAAACPAISEFSVHAEPPRVTATGAPPAILGAAVVELRSDPPGTPVHYTLDGSPPTLQSPRYAAPLELDRSCTLRAAAEFAAGLSPFELVREYEVWTEDSLLAPVASLVEPRPGLVWRAFLGGWQSLDRLAEAEAAGPPAATGVAARIDLSPRPRDEHFALVFTGFLRIPADGIYTFHLTSDDGSRLRLHDRLVIDHDGLHGMTTKSGRVALRAGLHPLRVEAFNATGGLGLRLEWEGPGLARGELPAAALAH
ncbi:MAG: alpha-L-fucosidase [Planctomycetota bacterium]|nr:MAG: alpha-L-fucosidase [Planctomycetota bacterium]